MPALFLQVQVADLLQGQLTNNKAEIQSKSIFHATAFSIRAKDGCNKSRFHARKKAPECS